MKRHSAGAGSVQDDILCSNNWPQSTTEVEWSAPIHGLAWPFEMELAMIQLLT